jgi:hypothetical protein
MSTIAMPTLRLMPVMMYRLVKSARCSQQQPIRTLLPASSGRIPLAQAQGSPPASAVDVGHEVQPPALPSLTKRNWFICALTYQGQLVCIARAQSAIWSSGGRRRASTAITLSSQ